MFNVWKAVFSTLIVCVRIRPARVLNGNNSMAAGILSAVAQCMNWTLDGLVDCLVGVL